MKRTQILLLVILLVFGLAQVTLAEKGNLKVVAQIITPIQMTQLSPLDFGVVYKGATTTTIDPLVSATGTSAGEFQLTGEPGTQVSITLPSSITITDGATLLDITAFTTSLSDNTGIFDATGNLAFTIGATLQNIPRTATSGVYSGNAIVTVAYNY